MLWYKSFREIRNLTLTGVVGLAVARVLIVLNQHAMRAKADTHMTYVAYIWKSIYNSIGRDMFLILSIILGSGGLLQERVRGTSGFTLALPISRCRIVVTHAIVGYLSVLVLAAVPIAVVPLASRCIGEQYPITQNVGFFCLWAGCGAVFYGITFLLAHLLEGDYIPVLLAIPLLMLYGALMNLPWLSRLQMLNIFGILNGEDMPFFNKAQHLLVTPLPWFALASLLVAGAAFVIFALRRIEPLDF